MNRILHRFFLLGSLFGLLTCARSGQFNPHPELDRWLERRFPYERRLLFTAPWRPTIIQEMPRGIGYRRGEFPIKEIPAPQAIVATRPGSRFFTTQIRTNEWHLGQFTWPIVVSVVGPAGDQRGVFISVRETDPTDFFTPFVGSWFHDQDAMLPFADGLADVVFSWLRSPCEQHESASREGAEVLVRQRCGRLLRVLHLYFDEASFFRGGRISTHAGA